MTDVDKINLDNIIARLLEGLLLNTYIVVQMKLEKNFNLQFVDQNLARMFN